MIWVKLTFGGYGRRFVEALAAAIVLAATSATVAASLMVVEGARNTLSRAIRQDRPDVVEVKSRFNRALFETPRVEICRRSQFQSMSRLSTPPIWKRLQARIRSLSGSRCFVMLYPATAF